MQLTINVEGDDAVVETAELRDWLHNARIREVERVTQEELPPKPDEQGPILLAVLTIVLNSKALIELVRSIHHCIEARTPRTKIKITNGKKSLTIDCVNPPPFPELVEQVKILAAA
jgi:hypothetical protein